MTGKQKHTGAALNLILLVSGLFFLSVNMYAQGIPDKPDMIRITAIHPYDSVLVQWEASLDTTIDLYHIYWMNEGTGTKVFTLSSETLEFAFRTRGQENLAYTVTAEDTLDGNSSRESLLEDNKHRVVAASIEFEPCEPANIINWTGYVGWEGLTSGYRIYGGVKGEPFQLLKFVHPNTRSYKHPGVAYDTTYTYYIETVHTSGIISLSPIEEVRTSFPDAPALLRLDEVSVTDNSSIKLRFTTDVDGLVNNFRIMRRSNKNTPYTEVETFWNSSQAIMTYDDAVSTRSSSYEYIVEAIYQPETCSQPITVSQSNPGASILLQSSLEAQVVYLSWNPYESYSTGLSGYIIQRRNGSGEFFDVGSTGSKTTSWHETIESLINGYQPGELHYKIIAMGNQVEGADPGISYSNAVSIAVETSMLVPNAFTPGRSSNYLFKPVIDFAPEKYTMIVYDRGGRKLFESNDPGEGWDGSYNGGAFAMEGVYVYFIQYTDYTGLSKTLTGNVTVIYPLEY
jgi:CHU domain-containing protein